MNLFKKSRRTIFIGMTAFHIMKLSTKMYYFYSLFLFFGFLFISKIPTIPSTIPMTNSIGLLFPVSFWNIKVNTAKPKPIITNKVPATFIILSSCTD